MNTKLLDQAIKTLESVRGALGSFAKADVDLTIGMLRQEKETAHPEQHYGGQECLEAWRKDGSPIPVAQPEQEPVAWNVINPSGEIVATESNAIRGWARIQGYKPTVEGLLGFHEKGWRVVPVAHGIKE